MEIIEVSGYTEDEKLAIATAPHPEAAGSARPQASIAGVWTDAGVMRVIPDYTREAGVRNLEREIGSLPQVALQVAGEDRQRVPITRRATSASSSGR